MKKICQILALLACFLTVIPLVSRAGVFFNDDFSHGSTVSSTTPVFPTTNSASYEVISAKSWSPTPSVNPGDLQFGLPGTSSGIVEVQAVAASNTVTLAQPGDYVQLTVVFTNTASLLINDPSNNTYLAFGLYNSSQSLPVAGGMEGTLDNKHTDNATGGAQMWQGYVARMTTNSDNILTRPAQTGSNDKADNQNQDLVSTGTSSSYSGASTVASASTPLWLTNGQPCTDVLTITLVDASTLAITNSLYDGPDSSGALLVQYGNQATGANLLTKSFDSVAVGWRQTHDKGSYGNFPSQMDISSISISGQISVVTTPPDITSQPVSVTVPAGAACAFNVAASGFNMTYQWHRNGTNLLDGGNISGTTSSQLVVSPASSADVAADYYVTITGAGDYSTNSAPVSLSLGTAKTLTWNGPGADWDLNNSANWLDTGANPSAFNFGDAVIFDGSGPGGVTLSDNFLSASSVTVSATYDFYGSGSIAGPGKLIVTGGNPFTIHNANTYTGGTVVSNSSADLFLDNYNGLGTGPVTMAGGLLEIGPAGSGSSGLPGDVVVNDDSVIGYNAVSSSYSVALFGNLSGTAGKTLTVEVDSLNGAVSGSGMDRVRLYGANTVYDGNLNLNDPTTLWAAYGSSQTYNGEISGAGAFMQKGSVSYLNGANTFSGGTFAVDGSIGLGADSTGSPGAVTSSPLGTGPLYLTVDSTSRTTGSSEIFAAGGARVIGNQIQYPSGTNNLTLIVGGTNDLNFSGPYTLNGNDGTSTYTTRTLQVDNTGLTTISGVISDGGMGFGFTKSGTGVLALNNTETYSGPTTVSAGTLLVNGQLGAGAVTASGGVIGGSGTIPGNVTVQNGGGLAPGNLGIGTLTVNGTVDLQAGSTTTVEVSKTGGTHDQVAANTINYGGTLMATNLSGSIAMGDSFPIFSAASHTGDFSAIAGSPGPGLAWSFDAASGTLNVVTGVATNPTNIVFSAAGGTLSLSWPSDHTGWTLQVQTNSLANGLQSGNSSWVTVPGSTSTNAMDFPIDPANGSVFYRLIYQP